MDIILREDIKGLGYKNDIVSVKPGYGRNYLIPQGMAIIASTSNRKMIEENIRQAAHKAEKALKDASFFNKIVINYVFFTVFSVFDDVMQQGCHQGFMV